MFLTGKSNSNKLRGAAAFLLPAAVLAGAAMSVSRAQDDPSLQVAPAPVVNPSLDDAVEALSASMATLENEPTQSAETMNLLVSAREALDGIEEAAPSLTRRERNDYAVSLWAQSVALEEAAQLDDAQLAKAMISDVSADLAIKAASGGLGATNTVRGHVTVNARTFRGGSEVGGLIVGANRVSYTGSDLLFRFERLSSPTTKPLPPGRYQFIVMQGDKVVARQTADVGLGSLAAVDLDLVVP